MRIGSFYFNFLYGWTSIKGNNKKNIKIMLKKIRKEHYFIYTLNGFLLHKWKASDNRIIPIVKECILSLDDDDLKITIVRSVCVYNIENFASFVCDLYLLYAKKSISDKISNNVNNNLCIIISGIFEIKEKKCVDKYYEMLLLPSTESTGVLIDLLRRLKIKDDNISQIIESKIYDLCILPDNYYSSICEDNKYYTSLEALKYTLQFYPEKREKYLNIINSGFIHFEGSYKEKNFKNTLKEYNKILNK